MAAEAPTVAVYVQDLMTVLSRVPPFDRTTAERAALARLKAATHDTALWLGAPPDGYVSLRQLIVSARRLIEPESIDRDPEFERGIVELVTAASGLGLERYPEIRRAIGLEADGAQAERATPARAAQVTSSADSSGTAEPGAARPASSDSPEGTGDRPDPGPARRRRTSRAAGQGGTPPRPARLARRADRAPPRSARASWPR
jgi:hypothetical protein